MQTCTEQIICSFDKKDPTFKWFILVKKSIESSFFIFFIFSEWVFWSYCLLSESGRHIPGEYSFIELLELKGLVHGGNLLKIHKKCITISIQIKEVYCWLKVKKNLASPHIFIFDLDRKYIVKFFLPIVKSIIRRKKLIFFIANNLIGKIKI